MLVSGTQHHPSSTFLKLITGCKESCCVQYILNIGCSKALVLVPGGPSAAALKSKNPIALYIGEQIIAFASFKVALPIKRESGLLTMTCDKSKSDKMTPRIFVDTAFHPA
jgi:hypothetical protein